MGRKRKRSTGHYCWMCGRHRPNERFSGKGHRTHVCKQCAALGPEARAHKQKVLALERCVTGEGFIPRKRRAAFEVFLRHEDPRLRSMAERLQRHDVELRETLCADREADEMAMEELGAAMADLGDSYETWGYELDDADDRDDDDIPF